MKEDSNLLFKKKLIETFKAFDAFCAENGLRYFATGGTAIGTVRHKGIIPWDDDMGGCSAGRRFISALKSRVLSARV